MSKEIQQNNQEYGADQIQILEGLEAGSQKKTGYVYRQYVFERTSSSGL
jgi:DNA gyrase subunit B